MSLIVDNCKRCGKIVAKPTQDASSDLLRVELRTVYLCDNTPKYPERPSLEIVGEMCPECLSIALAEFIDKVMGVPKSAIAECTISQLSVPGRKKTVKQSAGTQSNIDQFLNK